jgi:transcriptional regulator with XRE-family HTH domain
MKSIGDRIRIERESQKMSKAELGRMIGVTRAAISRIESGATKSPTAENLSKIADALGLSYQWLIDGKGRTGRVIEMAADFDTTPAQHINLLMPGVAAKTRVMIVNLVTAINSDKLSEQDLTMLEMMIERFKSD